MLNVALIGLGNIALLYDYNKNSKTSLSHVKGIYHHKNYNLKYCIDIDRKNEKKVKGLFPNIYFDTDINVIVDKTDIDVLVIATPTKTHFDILEKLKDNKNIKIFFIEKPLFDNLDEFSKIDEDIKNKIVINYIRNFEPNIIKLKNDIQEKKLKEVEKIVFYYTKGFKNNASHFISLINFLFTSSFYHDSKIITQRKGVSNDPTYDIFLELNYNGSIIPIYFIGLNHNNYAVFNVEFYFQDMKLVLDDVDKSLKYHKVIPNKDYPDYKEIDNRYSKIDLEYNSIMFYAYDYINNNIEKEIKLSSYELEKKNNKLYIDILKKG